MRGCRIRLAFVLTLCVVLACTVVCGAPAKKPAKAPPLSPEFRKLVTQIETTLKCKVTYYEAPKKPSRVVILCPEEHSDNADALQAKRIAAMDRAFGIDCVFVEGVPSDLSVVKPALQRFLDVMTIPEPYNHELGEPEDTTVGAQDGVEEVNKRCKLLRGKGSFPIIGMETEKSLLMSHLFVLLPELAKSFAEMWDSGTFEDGQGLPGDKGGPAGVVVQWVQVSAALLELAPDHLKPHLKDLAVDPKELVRARDEGTLIIPMLVKHVATVNSFVVSVGLKGRNDIWMSRPEVKKALADPRYRKFALVSGSAHADKSQEPGADSDLRDLLKQQGISWVLLPEVQ